MSLGPCVEMLKQAHITGTIFKFPVQDSTLVARARASAARYKITFGKQHSKTEGAHSSKSIKNKHGEAAVRLPDESFW